jgi:hypothetical protein
VGGQRVGGWRLRAGGRLPGWRGGGASELMRAQWAGEGGGGSRAGVPGARARTAGARCRQFMEPANCRPHHLPGRHHAITPPTTAARRRTHAQPAVHPHTAAATCARAMSAFAVDASPSAGLWPAHTWSDGSVRARAMRASERAAGSVTHSSPIPPARMVVAGACTRLASRQGDTAARYSRASPAAAPAPAPATATPVAYVQRIGCFP